MKSKTKNAIEKDQKRRVSKVKVDPANPSDERRLRNGRNNKRETILKAAALLFADRGYSATALRDIASEAGIKAGSIYYHFPSKEAIISEILDLGVRSIYEDVKEKIEAADRTDYRALIEFAISTHLQSLLKNSIYTQANYRCYYFLPEDIKVLHRPIRRKYEQFWEELLSEAQNRGQIRTDLDVRMLRLYIFGAMNKTTEWFDTFPTKIEKLSLTISSLILDGVGARDA